MTSSCSKRRPTRYRGWPIWYDDEMTRALDLKVPLKVDLASGDNWLDVEPVGSSQ